MRQGHFAFFFLVLYIVCFMRLYLEQKHYDMVLEEKQRVEECLKRAIEYAANELIPVRYESEEEQLIIFQNAFLEAFYIYMGVMEDTEAQEMLRMYFPMFILAEEEGAFFNYAKEVMQDGILELKYEWSDIQSFDFPENCSEEKKKSVMAEVLEGYASEIITNHNYIAEQYGLKYTFYVPDFLQDTSHSLELPMLFVVFQGWPLTAAGNVVYENCMDAGVYIQEVKKYVVELPTELTDTFCYVHEEDCERVKKGGKFLKEKISMEQAVREYGAVPCGDCVK